ncbi:hypothetical protein MBM_07125 [Drepanopeziza brunnea f. sp. 'multigermtubi' MB_m1]|uniref:Uncharacterized protein n=1 Tax=Marssonina brunnea f. sp. multigermtubi (strain MB_m1) TaxID=1072389 RepID=K1XQN5_MARBU|nr:uncharacterized protein MBM_07125 [Drepanopeziza brunnea f. sp. 'multigermtubi' MB_m1]EKD14914.1 hypothetical protein MBM_07125 [Drepanopeziza brunnea f. sp. 'multigermtubi' MB_m1]
MELHVLRFVEQEWISGNNTSLAGVASTTSSTKTCRANNSSQTTSFSPPISAVIASPSKAPIEPASNPLVSPSVEKVTVSSVELKNVFDFANVIKENVAQITLERLTGLYNKALDDALKAVLGSAAVIENLAARSLQHREYRPQLRSVSKPPYRDPSGHLEESLTSFSHSEYKIFGLCHTLINPLTDTLLIQRTSHKPISYLRKMMDVSAWSNNALKEVQNAVFGTAGLRNRGFIRHGFARHAPGQQKVGRTITGYCQILSFPFPITSQMVSDYRPKTSETTLGRDDFPDVSRCLSKISGVVILPQTNLFANNAPKTLAAGHTVGTYALVEGNSFDNTKTPVTAGFSRTRQFKST